MEPVEESITNTPNTSGGYEARYLHKTSSTTRDKRTGKGHEARPHMHTRATGVIRGVREHGASVLVHSA
jgi:hypothetical protein